MSSAGINDSPELARLARLGWHAESRGTVVDGVLFVGESIDVDYPEAGLDALGLEGGTGYWFDHRAQAVAAALAQTTSSRSIWDIGAGTGSMAGRLARAGYEVVAVEPLAHGARAIKRQAVGTVICSSLGQLELPDASVPVLGLFDVVEHIEEPRDLLAEVHRVLEPGGIVVLTVPAFPALWSDEDDVAGHWRRYRRSELDGFMTSIGFIQAQTHYLFATLVVPVALLRALPYRLGRRLTPEAALATASDQLTPGPIVDRSIRRLLHLESTIAARTRLPLGTTILGLYRRP